MTTNTDIVNRALQNIGTRTTVSDAELIAGSSNEAIQANIILPQLRDDLLRMAPWNCAKQTANLTYITSSPGTPENTSGQTNLWQPGQPPPPWGYEYQYPVNCLLPCFVIPSSQTGFTGIPITTAVTGGISASWWGTPAKFVVQIDQFMPVTGATVNSGGGGYVVGDLITLPIGPTTSPPIGAPAQLRVTAAPGGVISTVSIVNVISGASAPLGGSYFTVQPNPVAQGTTTGVGVGATFNLTFGPQVSQRVILTNQEFAILSYVKQITDPNIMDPLFQDAWAALLGARLGLVLTGDKTLANMLVQRANEWIIQARKMDGNEGLTINDVTPDFIRVRGVAYTEWYAGPYSQFDWGPLWSSF